MREMGDEETKRDEKVNKEERETEGERRKEEKSRNRKWRKDVRAGGGSFCYLLPSFRTAVWGDS